jgi:nitrate reductase NapA
MHPVLFSRMLEQRQKRPEVKIIDFATRTTRTSMAADRSILFRPQSDLAVANAICYEIIRMGAVNRAFLERHVSFHKGKEKIGYGLEDKFAFTDKAEDLTFEDFKQLLASTHRRRWRRSRASQRRIFAISRRCTPTRERRSPASGAWG